MQPFRKACIWWHLKLRIKSQTAATGIGQKTKGVLSIWLLGMFTPSAKTTVIIPFQGVPGARSFITDNYFGTMPRSGYSKKTVCSFTCDGKYRSKIGLSPMIAKPIAASFDFEKDVLTLVLPGSAQRRAVCKQ